jgi:hypothetical protein
MEDGVVHGRTRAEAPVVDVPAECTGRDAVDPPGLSRRDAAHPKMRPERDHHVRQRRPARGLVGENDDARLLVARRGRVVERKRGAREPGRGVDVIDRDALLAEVLVEVAPPGRDVRPVR